jgi:hypothetical protein
MTRHSWAELFEDEPENNAFNEPSKPALCLAKKVALSRCPTHGLIVKKSLRRPIDLCSYVSALGRPTEPVHYDENDTDLVKNSFQIPI